MTDQEFREYCKRELAAITTAAQQSPEHKRVVKALERGWNKHYKLIK